MSRSFTHWLNHTVDRIPGARLLLAACLTAWVVVVAVIIMAWWTL